MSNILKFQATHAIVGNAPAIINVAADDPVLMTREFSGAGAPGAATLPAGNGRYCASNSGFVVAATLVAPGINYKAGDVLLGGSGFAITLDVVTGTGAIADYHVSTLGNFAAYPVNPVAMAGGSGSGATFSLALQPADHYFDTTAKTLYACTAAGTNATSAWAKISGAVGGGGIILATITDASDLTKIACKKNSDQSVISVAAPPYFWAAPFANAYIYPSYAAGQIIEAAQLDVALTGSTAAYIDLNVGTSSPRNWFYDLLTCELVGGVPTQFTRGFCCTDRK